MDEIKTRLIDLYFDLLELTNYKSDSMYEDHTADIAVVRSEILRILTKK